MMLNQYCEYNDALEWKQDDTRVCESFSRGLLDTCAVREPNHVTQTRQA